MGTRRAEFRLHEVLGHALSGLLARLNVIPPMLASRLIDTALLTDSRYIAEPFPNDRNVGIDFDFNDPRVVQKWESGGGGTYFWVDPREDLFVVFMMLYSAIAKPTGK